MDQSIKDQIKQQHPNLKIYPIVSEEDGIEILVAGAPPALWTKYLALKNDFANPGNRVQADEMLVRGAMLWPNHEAFHKGLEERHLTGFYTEAAGEVALLTGKRNSVKLGEAL